MTTQTTKEETPRKRRLPAKIAKRIAELETEHASLVGGDKQILAAVVRTRIERLEQGLPEDPPEDEETVGELGKGYEIGPDGTRELTAEETAELHTAQPCDLEPPAAAAPTTTWNDVVNASTEADANRITREQTFSRVLVDLTPEERAELGAEHVAADAELAELTDEKKEAMADFKARIAKVECKKREIAEAITKKKSWREAPKEGWICEEIFATNTRRYLDPRTGLVVSTEAMTGEDRQLALPVVSEEKAAQLSLGEVDPTDLNDPESLLADAEKGEATPSNTSLEDDPEEDADGDDTSEDDEDDDQ